MLTIFYSLLPNRLARKSLKQKSPVCLIQEGVRRESFWKALVPSDSWLTSVTASPARAEEAGAQQPRRADGAPRMRQAGKALRAPGTRIRKNTTGPPGSVSPTVNTTRLAHSGGGLQLGLESELRVPAVPQDGGSQMQTGRSPRGAHAPWQARGCEPRGRRSGRSQLQPRAHATGDARRALFPSSQRRYQHKSQCSNPWPLSRNRHLHLLRKGGQVSQ